MNKSVTLLSIFLLLLSLAAANADSDDDCQRSTNDTSSSSSALPLKLAAIFSILAGGAVGVCVPILGRWLPLLRPERDFFLVVKAFAAGVILATGFIHILPDAYESLTSPCLKHGPWQKFPVTGLVAMLAAVGTLMVDSLASGYYHRLHFKKVGENITGSGDRGDVHDHAISHADDDVESGHGGHVHVHTHATHGHAHGEVGSELIRHRVVSQVLELGIVVHSVIIGISLGVSDSSSTIRPLVGALTFHQFFEGMGLGGCIVRAKFKARSMIMMILFFSLTTPVGIAVGIGISTVYNENSPTALIVEGILDAAAAGILIYMALVDLLAADFMSPRVQGNGWLQFVLNVSLLVGAGLMSMLAIWA